MLVLSRKVGERVLIADGIVVQVLEVSGRRIHLARRTVHDQGTGIGVAREGPEAPLTQSVRLLFDLRRLHHAPGKQD
jgi:hypothetical protein